MLMREHWGPSPWWGWLLYESSKKIPSLAQLKFIDTYLAYLRQYWVKLLKVKEAMCQKFKRYGTENICLLPPNIWALIPQNMKDSSSLSSFRNALENGNPTAHVIYANHFCSMFVFPNSTADLPSLLLIYVKFKLPVHDHIAYCL